LSLLRESGEPAIIERVNMGCRWLAYDVHTFEGIESGEQARWYTASWRYLLAKRRLALSGLWQASLLLVWLAVICRHYYDVYYYYV